MADDKPKVVKPRTNLSFIHGEYICDRKAGWDAYVGFLKDVETGEMKMKIVENPVVNVWVTNPTYRVYTEKREWSKKTELDEYTTRYFDRAECLWNALNTSPGERYRRFNWVNLTQQLSSPFVYGADIDFGVRMKYRFQKMNGFRKPMKYNVGSLDIETDVNGTNQIILITFIDGDGKTFVGILKEFYKSHTVQEALDLWNSKVEPEFRSKLNKKTLPIYDNAPKLDLNFKIFDQEVDLIKWIFDNIHACRPDFVTIWNIGYDIPYILDRLKFRQVDPADIICSPDVPKQYRVCWYKHDKGKKGDHITDHWDVFHCTDYTKYVDAMCMYGRLRKAKPREPSYQLNAIAGKELGAGKLEFGDEGEDINDHYTMQAKKQVKYTVYNIVDVLLLRLLEMKNNDTRTMMMLIGESLIDDFSRQSVQLKNMFFVYLDALGGVPGSIGDTLEKPWDKYLTNKGGQVLSPDRTRGTGVSILVDSDLISFVHKLVCDIDVSSMYPSLMSMLNCTRETKLSTILMIYPAKKRLTRPVPVTIEELDAIPEVAEGLTIRQQYLDTGKKEKAEEVMSFLSDRVQRFMFAAIYPESNAVELGSTQLGLPGFAEMDKLIEEDLKLAAVH